MSSKNKNSEWKESIRWLDDFRLEIPVDSAPWMRVPGLVYTDRHSGEMPEWEALAQVMNVASLPGIVGRSLAMPDIHYGYGFPIGGVAATDVSEGVISPGGVGFDINCGVRMLATTIEAAAVRKKADELCVALFHDVPSGVGVGGDIRVGRKDLEKVLRGGARWAVKQGYGWDEDIEFCEAGGRLEFDDMGGVTKHALERGGDQLGTLGAGNHFIEVQRVEKVFDERAAHIMGLDEGLTAVMIHSGSRGLGAQVCQDSLRLMRDTSVRYGYELPDRQLSCAPVRSPEGQEYFSAMCAAANYAWANRQCLSHRVRLTFEKVFSAPASRLGMHLIYDVAHNIARMEKHKFNGPEIELCVHRKGATRAFPAGHSDLPKSYATIGQPVIVPGDMGTSSYVMLGTQRTMEETWGSICHGAGRRKSRSAAKSEFKTSEILEQLAAKGISIQAKGKKSILEEAPGAYKNINVVVETCVAAGIATKVARLKPIAVIKG